MKIHFFIVSGDGSGAGGDGDPMVGGNSEKKTGYETNLFLYSVSNNSNNLLHSEYKIQNCVLNPEKNVTWTSETEWVHWREWLQLFKIINIVDANLIWKVYICAL